MFIASILVSLLIIGQVSKIESHNSMDRTFLKARNRYLRFYLYSRKDSVKNCLLAASSKIKDRTTRIYNRILSKYYDAHVAYYSLPEDDRDLIEKIINLHF